MINSSFVSRIAYLVSGGLSFLRKAKQLQGSSTSRIRRDILLLPAEFNVRYGQGQVWVYSGLCLKEEVQTAAAIAAGRN